MAGMPKIGTLPDLLFDSFICELGSECHILALTGGNLLIMSKAS